MSTTDARGDEVTRTPDVATTDMKLEVVVIPVSDVDRAKEFYTRLRWRLDADTGAAEGFRLVQFTPPGSACSVQFGRNLTSAPPGSAQGLHLVVSDIEAAAAELDAHGVATSGVYHCEEGFACRFPGNGATVPGPLPDHGTYGSFLSFADPDGNGWVLQEITRRFPGRVTGDTSYGSAGDLAQALRRAAAACGAQGTDDAGWPDRYAAFLVAEQSGEAPPA
ncbi:MAG TPA: VOC family protein [Mycobacteriales bacterium]